MTDQTNSDGSIVVEDVSEDDIRISKEDFGNLQKMVEKIPKKKEEVSDSEDEQVEEPVVEDDSVVKELENKIKLLEDANAQLEEKRKEELIAMLPKKERARCKDKSVEAIELLVGYFADNPNRAIPRTPTERTNEQTQELTQKSRAGSVGEYNFKTKKWETK